MVQTSQPFTRKRFVFFPVTTPDRAKGPKAVAPGVAAPHAVSARRSWHPVRANAARRRGPRRSPAKAMSLHAPAGDVECEERLRSQPKGVVRSARLCGNEVQMFN